MLWFNTSVYLKKIKQGQDICQSNYINLAELPQNKYILKVKYKK